MGLFDKVLVKCPNCQNNVALQTKAGKCTMAEYTPYELINNKNSATLDNGDIVRRFAMLEDIDGEVAKCECGAEFIFQVDWAVNTNIIRLDKSAEEEE